MRVCFSNLACPDWQFEKTVEAVATYGFDGIEVRLFDGEVVTPVISSSSRRRAEKALRDAAVAVAALDTSLQLTAGDPSGFQADIDAMAEIAQQWGAPLLRIFGGPLPIAPAERADALKRAAERLVVAATRAGRCQVRLALETHDDFSSAKTVAAVLDLTEGLGGAVYDAHHPHRVGETPAEVLEVLGAKVWHVHVKDAVRLAGDDEWQLVPLGEGEVPVKEMLSLLPGAGYDSWVSLEFEKKWHPELEGPDRALRPQGALLHQWLAAAP
jgi:sugar phosphate isomerase/epimerase